MGRTLARGGVSLIVAAAATTAALMGTANASAAPTLPTTTDIAKLSITQTPNVGVAIKNNLPTGAFVAPLAAASSGADTTRVWVEPMPGNACLTSLSGARIGITWRNESSGRTGTSVFAACRGATPVVSPALPTGTGKISFTTSVVGRGGQTFTLSPGSGTIDR